MANLLEDLVAQWFEYRGLFVRRNVRVEKLVRGGWAGELDVVALDPSTGRVIHVEASMDAIGWAERQKRFSRKFAVGKEHIPGLFQHSRFEPPIEHRALLAVMGGSPPPPEGEWRWWSARELFNEIRSDLAAKRWQTSAVPEQFGLVRALQFAAQYWIPSVRDDA